MGPLGYRLAHPLTVQMTATTWQVYNGGRIIAYFAVGIIQNTVPSYQAECAPAGLRGFFAGFMHMMTGMGNLVGSGIGRAYATEQGPKGYLICTGIQFVPAILLVILVPFCPRELAHMPRGSSPRVPTMASYEGTTRRSHQGIGALTTGFAQTKWNGACRDRGLGGRC